MINLNINRELYKGSRIVVELNNRLNFDYHVNITHYVHVSANPDSFDYMKRIKAAEEIRSELKFQLDMQGSGKELLFSAFAAIQEAYLTYTEELIMQSKEQ